MGGTLIISDNPDACWMPKRWIVEEALERIAFHVDLAAPALAVSLRSTATLPDSYGDWRELRPDEFRVLIEGAEHALTGTMIEERGFTLVDFPEPYYRLMHEENPRFEFMFCFSQLKALLTLDPRVPQGPAVEGRIVINDSLVWEAPGWVYNLILEHWDAHIGNQDAALTTCLIEARLMAGSPVCSLRNLTHTQFGMVLLAAGWMRGFYGDGRALISVAPHFYEQLAPRVVDLHTLLASDPRAHTEC